MDGFECDCVRHHAVPRSERFPGSWRIALELAALRATAQSPRERMSSSRGTPAPFSLTAKSRFPEIETCRVAVPTKVASVGARRIKTRFAAPRRATSGLPLFSMSSSKRSDKNILAHPTGGVFLSANFRADCWRKKMPPTRPSTSRATQNPSRFWPMKNSGIASLRIMGSGRCGSLVAAAGSTGGIMLGARI